MGSVLWAALPLPPRVALLRFRRSSHLPTPTLTPSPFDQGQSIFSLLDKKRTSTQRTHRPDDTHPVTQGSSLNYRGKRKGPCWQRWQHSKWSSIQGRECGSLHGFSFTGHRKLESCFQVGHRTEDRIRAPELWSFEPGL